MSLIIESIEYYLPENIVTNADLQKENPVVALISTEW